MRFSAAEDREDRAAVRAWRAQQARGERAIPAPAVYARLATLPVERALRAGLVRGVWRGLRPRDAEPTWPTAAGETMTVDGVTWTVVGRARA